MKDLSKWEIELLKDGKIDAQETIAIRQELWESGTINKEKADFLVRLRNQAKELDPSFTTMFFEAINAFVVDDDTIAEDKIAWMREMLMADGKIDEDEKVFLAGLNKAKNKPESFKDFYDECLKLTVIKA